MAELALEELSPFPLESLAWGFVRAPGEERLFLYAAYRERLRQSGATP
jgi:hypothetical protein